MRAFHSNWTRPFFARNPQAAYEVEPFELLTTALSALTWQKHSGPIRMLTDGVGAAYYQSLGLTFLWDDGVHTVLDDMPAEIDPRVYWAAGKLFALRTMDTPCMMIDTDFILWQNIEDALADCDCAAIHREDIIPSIYPPLSAFRFEGNHGLEALDWTVKPLNTALSYFGDRALRDAYCEKAIGLMRHSPAADDTLTYMVFAEQRLLAMMAKDYRVRSLSDLPALFGGKQQLYTHVWGFKQQMRESPALYADFCRRCAARLTRDFPEAAARLARVPSLTLYF